jgi:hypothetical protein
MPPDRLPRRVAEAAWPAPAGPCHKRMHAGIVAAIEAKTQVDVAAAVASKMPYARFKSRAAGAVRKRDMQDVLRQKRSTVSRYVRILGSPECFPNQLQDYLLGPVAAPQKALLLCRADMLQTARRLSHRCKSASPACPCCGTGAEETLEHAVLLCPAHASLREAMWAEVADWVGERLTAAVKGKPPAECLEALLGSIDWDGHRLAVMNVMGGYLAGVLAAGGNRLSLARAVCAKTPPGQAAPAQVAPAASVAERDTACQCCQQRFSKRHNVMLLCDGCDRGYHQRCLAQPVAKVPAGDWLCPGCVVQVAHGAGTRALGEAEGQACVVCCDSGDGGKMLLCDTCDGGYHWYCVGEHRSRAPRGAWHCPGCRPGRTTSARRGARAHGACATAGAQ